MSKLNPFSNKAKVITKNNIHNILKKYVIFQNINNIDIYQEAFIHESYSIPYVQKIMDRDNIQLASRLDGVMPLQRKSYERLEYLGDAIIEGVFSKYLFERYPDENEDFLSRMRVCLVKGSMLAYLSKTIGLDKLLVVSRTMEEKENARFKECILEDIFEAFIGALFEDFENNMSCGHKIVTEFLINLIEDERTKINLVDFILNDGNYKNKLVDYYRKIFRTGITFKINKIEEEDYKKIYYVDAFRNDTNELISSGNGVDNKQGQHDAAKNGLIKFNLVS